MKSLHAVCIQASFGYLCNKFIFGKLNNNNKRISYDYVFNLDSQKHHSEKKIKKAMQMEIEQLRLSLQNKTGIM